jgi:hypothetical protein
MADATLPRPFDPAALVRLEWQLRSKLDGRVLRCGVFDTREGRRLMAGYDDGWLWHARVDQQAPTQETAAEWRRAVLSTGQFETVDPEPAAPSPGGEPEPN